MKKRIGFVSNSSSSSFIITMKKAEELTKENIMKIIDPGKDSFFHNMAKEISEIFMDRIEQIDIDYIYAEWVYPIEYMLSDVDKIKKIVENGDSPYDEKTLRKILEGSIVMYQGSVADDDGGMGAALCDMTINFEDDNIKIEKDGGY